MRNQRLFAFLLSVGLVLIGGIGTLPLVAEEIPNWEAPSFWQPPSHRLPGQIGTLAATSPLPFIAITPCRVVDTRGNGFTGAYGPPALVGNGAARTFNIPAGPCPGIPANAGAYSINVAAILPATDGFMTVFPTGASQPTTSDLNFLGGEVIANAIVAPAGTGGAISVFVNVSTDMILDINGYYAGAGVGTNNTFLGRSAGNFTMTGDQNTAVGDSALFSNSSGNANTAIGFNALRSNSDGTANVAVGWEALRTNVSGFHNTAVGIGALLNGVGSRNTGLGYLAGSTSTSTDNTAVGYRALVNSTGGGNIGLGSGAGANNTSGGFNMYLGNEGIASESTTIRIGSGLQHTRLFVAGVLGSVVTGSSVLINGLGQLGVAASSARFKEDIRDMGEASDRLMKLRPVSFRYKGHAADPVQFGLIAEEVEKVLPELVLRNAAGDVETVLYHEMPAMLLNELQKQQKRVESQEETIDRQQTEIDGLKEHLRQLEARFSEPARAGK